MTSHVFGPFQEALALWMVILQHHPSPQHVLLDSVIELLKGMIAES